MPILKRIPESDKAKVIPVKTVMSHSKVASSEHLRLKKASEKLKQQFIQQQTGSLMTSPKPKKAASSFPEQKSMYGRLASLMADPAVTEIMVYAADGIYYKEKGDFMKSRLELNGAEELMDIIHKLAEQAGQSAEGYTPTVEGHLPDDTYMMAILPPFCLNGPVLSLVKKSVKQLTVQDLIESGTFSKEIAAFAEVCVKSGSTILITGEERSGKTVILNALASLIPADSRLIALEEKNELKVKNSRVITLDGNYKKTGVPVKDLAGIAVRIQPDKILMDDFKPEYLCGWLQAIKGKAIGMIAAVQAGTPERMVSQLESCARQNSSLFRKNTSAELADCIDFIFYQTKTAEGRIKVSRVIKVTKSSARSIQLEDIFQR